MPILLRCLGGSEAPEPVQTGWARYQELSDGARLGLWASVTGGLILPSDPGFRSQMDAFCEQHGAQESLVQPALQACGLLLGQAAALDLTAEQFRSDLEALSSGQTRGVDEVMSQFDSLKRALRESMVVGTLADHGKVLLGLDWRVDRMASSNRAVQLETDVVFLTLRYREGDALDRITLQLSTQGIRDLRTFLDRFGY